jgi:hypothetical protein
MTEGCIYAPFVEQESPIHGGKLLATCLQTLYVMTAACSGENTLLNPPGAPRRRRNILPESKAKAISSEPQSHRLQDQVPVGQNSRPRKQSGKEHPYKLLPLRGSRYDKLSFGEKVLIFFRGLVVPLLHRDSHAPSVERVDHKARS